MATTKIWDIRGQLGAVVAYIDNREKTENTDFGKKDLEALRDVMDYACDDFKTEQQFYVSGVNCTPDTARRAMMITKKRWGKQDGIIAYHAYQSFAPGEVTPQLAHEIGLELARRLWGGRFEAVVATHLDKAHIHNHFVINSVSFTDGKKYYDNKASYRLLRETSDELCRSHRLSVIENPQRTRRPPYNAYLAERDGQATYRGMVRGDVDEALVGALTMGEFLRNMQTLGYEIKRGKYLAVRPAGRDRFTRLKTLGEEYTEDAITERILRNAPYMKAIAPAARAMRYNGSFSKQPPRKVTGLRALYLHYCYKMGILPKTRSRPPARIHPLLRDELLKLERLTAQIKLLAVNKIDTAEQLDAYMDSVKNELAALTEKRDGLNKEIRRLSRDKSVSAASGEAAAEREQALAAITPERDAATKRIKQLRKELATAGAIHEDSVRMRERLGAVMAQNTLASKAAPDRGLLK